MFYLLGFSCFDYVDLFVDLLIITNLLVGSNLINLNRRSAEQ